MHQLNIPSCVKEEEKESEGDNTKDGTNKQKSISDDKNEKSEQLKDDSSV